MSLSVVPSDAVMEGVQYSLLITSATIQCDGPGLCFLYIDLTISSYICMNECEYMCLDRVFSV